MLDKITVYRRSDVQESSPFSLNFVGDSILLQVNDFVGSLFALTKTDPLNKFKNEIEGWWFCEEYVVILSEEAIEFTYYNYADILDYDKKEYGVTQTTKDITCSEFLFTEGSMTIDKYLERWKIKEPKEPKVQVSIVGEYAYEKIVQLQKELKEIELKFKEIELKFKETLNSSQNPRYILLYNFLKERVPSIKHGTSFSLSYLGLGEEKYLKLLEIIN